MFKLCKSSQQSLLQYQPQPQHQSLSSRSLSAGNNICKARTATKTTVITRAYGGLLGALLLGALGLSGCERLNVGPSPAAAKGSNPFNPNVPNEYILTAVIDAKLPVATQTLNCSAISDQQVITVKGHLKLNNGCDLTGKGVRFVLDSANTSLDCNGAQLSPREGEETNKSAITIAPKTDQAISNIAVANCHVSGYGHALHIHQHTNPNIRYVKGFIDPDANRALAPHDIRIINLSSRGSDNSGIFVGDHVHHVSFDRLTVMRSGTVGLYLEFGSQHNSIQHSVFIDNGYRTFKPNREAISVDSSSFNRIKDNEFIHNGAGGIQLYRNCFEHAGDPSRSNHFKRTESAANNVIEHNTFRDEPVGVWVASRQSRNLKGFECGAYPLAETFIASYYIDSAKNNVIKDNTFINVDQGIIVEDDGTQIIGNDFTQVRGVPFKIGSDIRQKYAHKVSGLTPEIKGTVIEDNKMKAKMDR